MLNVTTIRQDSMFEQRPAIGNSKNDIRIISREGNTANIQEEKILHKRTMILNKWCSQWEEIRDPEMLRFGLLKITYSNPHP